MSKVEHGMVIVLLLIGVLVTLACSGCTTARTNFFFYVSATNWAGTWADYTAVYHGINSNGTIRTVTNAWGW